MLTIVLLGISALLNVLLVRAVLGWRKEASENFKVAHEQHLMLDLTFYMLTKKAGVAEGDKQALMETIGQLAPLPVQLKVSLADQHPLLTEGPKARLGF